VSAALALELVGRGAGRPAGREGSGYLLSPRELQILAAIRDGGTNKTVAAEMGISEQTVKNHMSSMLAKTGAYTRTAAVLEAVRWGQLDIPGLTAPATLRAIGQEIERLHDRIGLELEHLRGEIAELDASGVR
jgi:DNA-binding CsgD family transcriptional regulator